MEQKQISFWIPRRDMREESSYFQRLGSEIWDMAKLYCIPKLRTSLKSVTIETGLTDAEEVEDGYLSAAFMWQRAVYGIQGGVVSN